MGDVPGRASGVTARPDLLARLDPTRATPRHRPGAVYLLPHHNRERFKVGWSLHPMQHIQQLPEFHAQALDLVAAQVAWFAQARRAHQVERVLHRSLAPFNVRPDHWGDGHTEWFNNQGIVLARRMLSLLPAADGDMGHTRLQALLDAPEAPSDSAFAPPPAEASALDTWYRVEDLWLRLGALLPLAVQADREQRCLHWLGMRKLVEPGSLQLRSCALNLETYQWRDAGQRRSLVTLMDWEQDDLLLQLMPTRQLQRWAEGDVVADLLRGHLARHAIPLRRCEGLHAGQAEGTATAWRSAPVPTG
jgi:hypothetical protein